MKKLFIATIGFIGFVYISLAVYVGLMVNLDNKNKSDVILVLGARSYKKGTYNPCLIERVRHGVNLYKNSYAEHILMTGGTDTEDNANESEVMKEIAVKMGVLPSSILVENKASSTYENIIFSKKIMETKGFSSAIIVTEPFHSPRAGFVADRIGLIHYVSPTQTSQCWTRWKFASRFFLKEPIAIIWYWIMGKI
ncbi:MAG: YdcF family protein [Patescibacteria group bacterium]